MHVFPDFFHRGYPALTLTTSLAVADWSGNSLCFGFTVLQSELASWNFWIIHSGISGAVLAWFHFFAALVPGKLPLQGLQCRLDPDLIQVTLLIQAVHIPVPLHWSMRRRPSVTSRGHIAIKPLVISSSTGWYSQSCCLIFCSGFLCGAVWILWLLLA